MDPSAATSSPRGTRTSRTRRTRFVCISDTHNCTVRLPRGDVLIHAGDLTNQGSYSELAKAVSWLENAPFECKIVVAGNHDLTLDHPFYNLHSASFHNQTPQDPVKCLSLLTSSPSITYLSHSASTIRLSSPSGPRTTFTVFGSPYSPRQETGLWAFQYDRDSAAAAELWGAIPPDTDVLVTHTPPYRHCDEGGAGGRRAAGCEVLRRAMWRVRPRVHVCGHVHGGRGVERVRWDLDGGGGNVRFMEAAVEGWTDEGLGSGKMSLVDLTGRRGRALDNDGGHPCGEAVGGVGATGTDERIAGVRGRKGVFEGDLCYGLYVPKSSTDNGTGAMEPPTRVRSAPSAVSPGAGTVGLGLSPDTDRSHARSDVAALEGRLGRRETCVVNCAITATSWPHAGGRRFNKPIVFDLDLPVWAWEMEQEDAAFGIVGKEA